MKRLCPHFLFFLLLVSTAHSLSWEVGAVAGAGPCLSYGSYLDSRQATLAELGSTTPGKPGSSKPELFLGWSVGGYVEAGILDWFALRAEPRLVFMGSSSLALTDAGDSFDHYGYYFYGVELPILSRFKLALGPGRVCLSVGPFLAITASGLTIVGAH
jgi:hypothetical protein